MGNTNGFDPLQMLLNQLNTTDPQTRQILENYLKDNPSRSEPTKDEILRRFRIQNKKLQEQLLILKEQLKKSKEEEQKLISYLDHFLKLNTALSAALGSCENCWGNDPDCDRCGGEGIPGWRPVNKRLYALYVQPCIAKATTGTESSQKDSL
jgi:hypothetical protein